MQKLQKNLKIIPLAVLQDNYIWLIQQDQQVIIVDPAKAQPVLDFLTTYQLQPVAILLTHNHHDHTDGVPELATKFTDLPIYGSAELAPFANIIVQDGDAFTLLNQYISVIKSPGHTAQHISYLINQTYLFCGDALFSGGCGRVFTGDHQAQFDTLKRFNALPDFVKVYPAHEYTQSNLKFAEAVLPSSCGLMEYQERTDILRAQNLPTLPTSIEREKQINPFMRAETLDEFIQLRQAKDRF